MELKTRSGRNPSQHPDEIFPFIDFLKGRGVRSYLEVGARHGDTFHLVAKSLPEGARVVAMDLPGGAWGKSSSVNALRDAIADLSGYDAHMILGDSTKRDIIAKAKALGPYDAILIDGDHRYDGVKKDCINYAPMGSIIAFHDIVGEGQTTKDGSAIPVEVPRLWREIKEAGDYKEIYEFIGDGSAMGIGVIVL